MAVVQHDDGSFTWRKPFDQLTQAGIAVGGGRSTGGKVGEPLVCAPTGSVPVVAEVDCGAGHPGLESIHVPELCHSVPRQEVGVVKHVLGVIGPDQAGADAQQPFAHLTEALVKVRQVHGGRDGRALRCNSRQADHDTAMTPQRSPMLHAGGIRRDTIVAMDLLFEADIDAAYAQVALWDAQAIDSYPDWGTGEEECAVGPRGVAVATRLDGVIRVRIVGGGTAVPSIDDRRCAVTEIEIGNRGIEIGNEAAADVYLILLPPGRVTVAVYVRGTCTMQRR